MKSVFRLFVFALFNTIAHAQNFTTQEPFHLINIGNGAAALGMGGAYVAIADDLSAFTWNPAGLSNKTGFRMQFDSAYTNGSENFEVTTFQSGTTQHDFSVNGFQPQSFALTYQFQRGDTVFGPAFAWNRSTLSLHNYKMDAPATGHYESPLFFISADYSTLYNRTYDRGGEDVYSFGFSLRKKRFAIGAIWNLLGGDSTQAFVSNSTANGTRLYIVPDGESVVAPFSSRSDVTTDFNEKYSGNYLNVGILYEANKNLSIGSTIRFGYSRKVEATELNEIDFELIGLVPFSDHHIFESDPSNLQSKIPFEFSGGVAIHFSQQLHVGSSLTFADYTLDDKPPGDIDYPTNHDFFQSALIQWRNGLEYQTNDYISLRGGFIIDDQPYTLEYYPVNKPDDSPFYGFTFGGGLNYEKVSFDIAFLHESGRGLFGARLGGISDHDVQFSEGHLSHNRFFFSMKFQQ